MNWQDICDHPTLRDLSLKLETGRWGHIVTSPASNRHSLFRAGIQKLLRTDRVKREPGASLKNLCVLGAFAVQTVFPAS